MKTLSRLAAGIAVAVGISASAHATTIDFPTISNPYNDTSGGLCFNCSKSYEFTLPNPYEVSIQAGALGGATASSWSLTETISNTLIASGTNPAFIGLASVTSFGPQLLQAGSYLFNLSARLFAGGYSVTISGTPVQTSTSVPEPASIALFATGLLAFGGFRRMRGKRAATKAAA